MNAACLAQRNRANLALIGEQVGCGTGDSEQLPQIAHLDELTAVIPTWVSVATVTDIQLWLFHNTTLTVQFSDFVKPATYLYMV
jgi:hypothetical protein